MGSIPTRGNDIFTDIDIFDLFTLVSKQGAALSSATQHEMPPEIGGKWGTVCNTRFPLPTVLCAGYSVKLILFKFTLNKCNQNKNAKKSIHNLYFFPIM